MLLRADYRTINHIADTAQEAGSAASPRWRPKCLSLAIAVATCLATAMPAAGAPAPKDRPAPKIVARIAFAGDSIVDNYWESIARVIEANPCLKATVALGRFARNGTGLSRGDKLYWPREVRKIGESFKPDLFVLSIGLNDQQFIVDGDGKRTNWGAPNWAEKYREQIIAFLNGAAASKAAVLLIGLPVVRDPKENADLLEKNKMFAAAVATVNAPHMQYIEPWRLKATGPDVFASYGPDRNGRMVQIRTTDGEHFTVAGEDILATYLYPKIVAAFAAMGTPLDRACRSPDAPADKAADTRVETKKEP